MRNIFQIKKVSIDRFSLTLLFFVYLTPVYSITGYLREAETSFCMDDCSVYYLEEESGEFTSWVTQSDNLEMLEPYVNRFVEIQGEEIDCVECTALNVEFISMSDACEFPVECFADPCTVEDCFLYPDAECVANYCDGCWADFYINGELLDCSSNLECIDLTGIDFGACDMALGIGWREEECQYLSGCDWVVDDVDYSDAFFAAMEECYAVCSATPPQESISIDYLSDWNLVSLPLDVEDASYSTLFPESIEGTLYFFDNGYIAQSYLFHGEGYWLRFPNAGISIITGFPISELTISQNEGWNLISGISESIAVGDISDPSTIIVSGTIYGFGNDGYSQVNTLEPGEGYWVRANDPGNIILTSN